MKRLYWFYYPDDLAPRWGCYANTKKEAWSDYRAWKKWHDERRGKIQIKEDVESLSVTRVSTPAERLQAARAAKKERK